MAGQSFLWLRWLGPPEGADFEGLRRCRRVPRTNPRVGTDGNLGHWVGPPFELRAIRGRWRGFVITQQQFVDVAHRRQVEVFEQTADFLPQATLATDMLQSCLEQYVAKLHGLIDQEG